MATKKPAADKPTAPAESVEVEFDIASEDTTPGDGDLCKVRVFDEKKGKAADGPICVFDAPRGVFFKDPERGGGGSVIGPRRDNYKAERVRNVVAFTVIEAGHNPNPEPMSVIDHKRGLEHASSRPPQVSAASDD